MAKNLSFGKRYDDFAISTLQNVVFLVFHGSGIIRYLFVHLISPIYCAAYNYQDLTNKQI